MEQIAELIGGIIGITLGISFCIAIVIGLILAIISDIKTWKMRKELIDSMNDHDKSVIMTYKNTQWTFKKKQKNEIKKTAN